MGKDAGWSGYNFVKKKKKDIHQSQVTWADVTLLWKLYVFGSRLCDSVSPTVEQRVIRAPSTEGYVCIRVWALATLTNQVWPSFLSKSIEQAIVKEKKHTGIKDQETQ